MSDRIDMLRQFKILTDDALIRLNRMEMAYENAGIHDEGSLASRLICELYKYEMKNIDYMPITLASIKNDICLKVDLGI